VECVRGMFRTFWRLVTGVGRSESFGLNARLPVST